MIVDAAKARDRPHALRGNVSYDFEVPPAKPFFKRTSSVVLFPVVSVRVLRTIQTKTPVAKP
jgi:hypothetical protein